jgi:hypothetical protein
MRMGCARTKLLDRVGIPAPFSNNSEMIVFFHKSESSFMHRLCLLGVCFNVLYGDFSPSRRNSLLVFHKVWYSHQLNPNLGYSPQGRLLRCRRGFYLYERLCSHCTFRLGVCSSSLWCRHFEGGPVSRRIRLSFLPTIFGTSQPLLRITVFTELIVCIFQGATCSSMFYEQEVAHDHRPKDPRKMQGGTP